MDNDDNRYGMPLAVAHRLGASQRANAEDLHAELTACYNFSDKTLELFKSNGNLSDLGPSATGIKRCMYKAARDIQEAPRRLLSWGQKNKNAPSAKEACVKSIGELIRTALFIDPETGTIVITQTDNQNINELLPNLKTAIEEVTKNIPAGQDNATVRTELRDALVALGEAKKGDPYHSSCDAPGQAWARG